MTEADVVILGPPEWDTGWTWPLDQAQGFFEGLWNKAYGAWVAVYGFIRDYWDWIEGIGGWVWDKVHNAWDWFLDKFTWLYESVKDRIREIFGALKAWSWGVPGWIWDKVYNFWDWLADKVLWVEEKVRDWAWAIVGSFPDWGAGFTGWLGGTIHNIWQWLNDRVRWLSQEIYYRLKDAFGALKAWSYGVAGWVWAKTYNIWDWIKDKFLWVSDRAWEVGGWVRDRILEAREWIQLRIVEARDWLRDHVIAQFREFLGWGLDWASGVPNWISGVAHTAWAWLADKFRWVRDRITDARDWFGSEIIDPWTDYIREVWQWIKQGLSGLWMRLREFISGAWSWLMTNIAEPVYNAISGAVDWLRRKFEEVIRAFFNNLQAVGASHSPILPEEVVGVFGSLLGVCLLGVGGIAVINIASELLHPLRQIGIGHVSRIIYAFTDIGRVSGMFVGALLGAMLKIPAEYYYNKMFRPRIPTWAELQGMARKHELSREEFFAAMPYHGFSDEWIEHIYYYMWADPRLYDILRLADVATPEGLPTNPELIARLGRMGISAGDPDWWLKMKFMLGGYEDVDIGALTQVVHKRESLEERGRYITQVRNMYHWGYWDRGTALDALRQAGLNSAQMSYTLMAEDLWFEREILDDKVLTYREAFRRDQINEADLRLGLTSLIPRSSRAHAIVALESMRKIPRPPVVRPKPPPPLYQRPEGKKRVQAAIVLYRGELIDDGELLRRLLGQEMPVEEAEATVDLERARLAVKPAPKVPEEPAFFETPEGKIRVHTNRTLYRAGLLSDRELVQGLEDLEMPTSFAQAVLEDEQAYLAAHPPAPPPPAPPKYRTDEGRAILSRDKQEFRTGRIDAEELGRRLLALEMTAEMAGALVDYEVLHKITTAPPPPPPPPPRYKTDEGRAALRLATERFRTGGITKQVFYQRLLALEMDEDQARWTVEYEALRLE